MTSEQASLDLYANAVFYKPKDIYLQQLNIFDNRQIYDNVNLASYIKTDKVAIKANALHEINLKKQRLLIELEQLKNGKITNKKNQPVFLKGVNLMFTTHCTMLRLCGLLACRLSHFWQTVRIRWSSLWEIWSKTQYDFLFSFQTSKECFFGREYLFCNHQKFFLGFFGAHHTVFKWNMLMPQNAQRRHKNPCFSLWNIQVFFLRYSPTETTTVIYHYILHCCAMYSTLQETT